MIKKILKESCFAAGFFFFLHFFRETLYNHMGETCKEEIMAKKKNQKVVRYRRPLNINVGMIIFALIFRVYGFLCLYLCQAG